MRILSSINKSRYDALTFKVQRRLPRVTLQAHYTLAGAFAYGGSIAARGAAPIPQDAFEPFAEGEWGPTGTDERHRARGDGRVRDAVRHPAVAGVPGGDGAALQPDRRAAT